MSGYLVPRALQHQQLLCRRASDAGRFVQDAFMPITVQQMRTSPLCVTQNGRRRSSVRLPIILSRFPPLESGVDPMPHQPTAVSLIALLRFCLSFGITISGRAIYNLLSRLASATAPHSNFPVGGVP